MRTLRHGPRAGSLLVEAMIALVVLVTAVLGFSRSATAGMQHQRSITERGLAMGAAQEILEQLRDLPLEQVFARYNADSLDDPEFGLSPGPHFQIERLQAPASDEDGLPGQVLFPVSMGAGGAIELREDLVSPRFGLPRDLNGDAMIGSEDVSGSYRLLPVAVRVHWRSAGSVQEVELRTWLGQSFEIVGSGAPTDDASKESSP